MSTHVPTPIFNSYIFGDSIAADFELVCEISSSSPSGPISVSCSATSEVLDVACVYDSSIFDSNCESQASCGGGGCNVTFVSVQALSILSLTLRDLSLVYTT